MKPYIEQKYVSMKPTVQIVYSISEVFLQHNSNFEMLMLRFVYAGISGQTYLYSAYQLVNSTKF